VQPDRINLLPKGLRKSPHDAQYFLIIAWIFAVILTSGGTGFNLWQSKVKAGELAEATESAKALENQALAAAKKTQSVDEMNKRISQSSDFLAKKVRWTGALKELSLLIPKTVWLSNFTMRKTKKNEPFIDITGSASSQKKIASFLESLEMSYYFRDVNLKKSEKISGMAPDLFQFELEIRVPQLATRGSP
jgi:Tfp pilus assembly protein PilN